MLPPHSVKWLLDVDIHIDKLRKAGDRYIQRYAIVSSRHGSTAAASSTGAAASSTAAAASSSASDCGGDCYERDDSHESAPIPFTQAQW
jgi:hypothetical protein